MREIFFLSGLEVLVNLPHQARKGEAKSGVRTRREDKSTLSRPEVRVNLPSGQEVKEISPLKTESEGKSQDKKLRENSLMP